MYAESIFFAFTDVDGWHAGIGDPTVMGWVTVVAYFLAATFCYRAFRKIEWEKTKEHKIIWLTLCAALLFLGVIKINGPFLYVLMPMRMS